jgi:hypothetical protein
VEAVGPAGNDSDLAIEALGATVVEASGNDGNDAVDVFADCLRGCWMAMRLKAHALGFLSTKGVA